MKLPRRPAAVIFDMDGLLFDTETLYQDAILLAAAEKGHEVVPSFFTQTIGLPWAQCRALLLSHFGETFAVDEFQEAWGRHFWMIAETRLSLKLGALELLGIETRNRRAPDVLDSRKEPRRQGATETSGFGLKCVAPGRISRRNGDWLIEM
jgi:beta-phosphoglucomutase-like phosphatase (HAD superfamily)